MVGRGKLNDGASAWITCIVSVAPVRLESARAVMMSTGTAFSASAPGAREPTVTASVNPMLSAKFCTSGAAVRITVLVIGRAPSKVAVSSIGWPIVAGDGTLIVNRPASSVVAWIAGDVTLIVAPARGCPFSRAVTSPVTLNAVCADADPPPTSAIAIANADTT